MNDCVISFPFLDLTFIIVFGELKTWSNLKGYFTFQRWNGWISIKVVFVYQFGLHLSTFKASAILQSTEMCTLHQTDLLEDNLSWIIIQWLQLSLRMAILVDTHLAWHKMSCRQETDIAICYPLDISSLPHQGSSTCGKCRSISQYVILSPADVYNCLIWILNQTNFRKHSRKWLSVSKSCEEFYGLH